MKYLFILLFLLLLTGCAAQDATEDRLFGPVEQLAADDVQVFSPSDIYREYSNSVYYVKTECFYTYTYPDYFLRSSVSGQWGVLIDLTMKKAGVGWENQGDWKILTRANGTKQYGTAFAVGERLFTNNHVVECPATVEDIVLSFDLNDLSGEDLNEMGQKIYDSQQNFEEVRTSRELILRAVNNTVAEHFRSKARFTLTGRKVLLYHQDDGFTTPVEATVLANGTSFPGTDYAVISIGQRARDMPTTDDLTIGNTVYLLGFPWITAFSEPALHGGAQTNPPVVTRGIIGNRVLSDENVTYYVVDAAATFGSSGSPVFNERGEVIGIVTAGDLANINLLLPMAAVRE